MRRDRVAGRQGARLLFVRVGNEPRIERDPRLASREETGRLLAEEHVLIHAAQKGDRDAFAILVERYWDRLYRWLYHLCHHRHTAEDLAQEALLKAFAHLSQFQLHRDRPEPANRLRSGSAPAGT